LTTVNPPRRVEINDLIEQVVVSLGHLTAGQLVTLSHARDGPWDIVYRKTKSQPVLGLRISNDLIRERAKFHKVSVDKLENVREPDEDSPLTNYRFG
jgi:hypothetical protein